ncbi:MAG: type IX secretion system sortase PorU, partial [Flavobacteriales bacterium]|nr:type IX secretion system sortase PorU [Flavobacteriales bacterium]
TSLQTRSNNRSFVSSSVMAPGSGDWYKMGVLQNGVYKVSYEDLVAMGANLQNVNSDAINLFGNSFGMLPEYNLDYRPDDLLQNAIEMHDGNDGTFDAGDYFLFYAKSAHTIKYNVSGQYYYHTSNIYCDTSYYFVNVNSSTLSPKRITNQSSTSLSATHTVTSFDEMKFIEPDQYNLVKSGREWYGDLFDFSTENTYSFSFPNIDVTQPVRVKADMAAKTPGSGSSNFYITGVGTSGAMTISIPGVGTGSYAAAANPGNGIMNFLPVSSSVDIKIQFNKYSAISQGWLNYLEVTARRLLLFTSGVMEFKDKNSVGTGNVADYQINYVSSDLHVWEVTDPTNVMNQNLTLASGLASFRLEADALREFVCFSSSSSFGTPVKFGKVDNQDLHALSPTDLIIVTHPNFYNQAQQLADLHNAEGTTSQVVNVFSIYNEFSSGMKDATAIKQFLRMFYERAGGDPNLLPKYVLLMGDGSYDNKNRAGGNTSFIPTYESIESTLVTVSFVSDDYFVMLDPTENMNNSDLLDMAVGRIPCQNTDEAQAVVDKIRNYSQNSGNASSATNLDCCNANNNESLGDWRNWYVFIADDEDANTYIDGAEEFADSLKLIHPVINVEKIYLDAFLQESTPGGERYPQATEKIKSSVERGALVVNYIGHGGEVGWAHERILDVATVNGWSNSPRLPLFMTATCEFSRFDDPGRTSAGEYVLLNGNGGGIALLTTTRLVYSGPNETLNKNFNRVVLQRSNGNPRTLGDIFMLTKNLTINQILTSNTRNFTLLGDPAVRLKLPQHKVVADSINSVAIGGATDTLKALSRITVTGHIEDQQGNILTSYNGICFPTVFDKEQTLYTLGNDPGSYVRSFDLRNNVIYRGKATITNGYFSFSFVVPKDISYQFGPGKFSFYAHDGSVDANGYDFNFIVGGTNPNAPVDDQGPTVHLFLNDENFVPGSITNENPKMFAKVSDENGVNTVGTGIGHDITAVLDGNTSNPIVLNEFYQSEANTYQAGVVSYQFEKLSEGNHELKFKVWDVYNNSAEATTDFVVASSAEIALDHVLNYPNPFTTRTQFFFEHNQSCAQLDVQIQVFTVAGKLVKTIQENVATQGYRISPIEWDGTDDYGDKLAIGTYVYRVKVRTEDGNTLEKFEKLVILR